MAIQDINVGLLANDGTGDDLREAFIKVNQNFDELDLKVSAVTEISAENIGDAGYGIFAQEVSNTFQFRKLLVDPLYSDTMSIRISDDGNNVYLASATGYTRITDGTTSAVVSPTTFITINGTGAAQATVAGGVAPSITIDSLLSREITPTLNATLNANSNPITNITSLNDITMAELEQAFEWDFGDLTRNRTSIIDFILKSVDVDFGTSQDVFSPADGTADFGNSNATFDEAL